MKRLVTANFYDLVQAEREYKTIVVDPPWPYKDAGKSRSTLPRSKGTIKVNDWTYQSMSLQQLERLPIEEVSSSSCHLYLWTTNAFMLEAHELAKYWGFVPKTIITWVKTRKDNPCIPSMKTGYYFRGATEHDVFSVKGSLPLRTSEGIPTAFLHPRLPHSVKPDKFMELVERCSSRRRLEMFARRKRKGWDAFGDQL